MEKEYVLKINGMFYTDSKYAGAYDAVGSPLHATKLNKDRADKLFEYFTKNECEVEIKEYDKNLFKECIEYKLNLILKEDKRIKDICDEDYTSYAIPNYVRDIQNFLKQL